MKKISKIFLVLTMIFSQLSSVVTVLADEVADHEGIVNVTQDGVKVGEDTFGYDRYVLDEKDYILQ